MGEGDIVSAGPRRGASLRFKLILFVATLVLLAGGATALVSISRGYRASQQRIHVQLENLASLIATGGMSRDAGGGIDGKALQDFVKRAQNLQLPVAYLLFEDGDGVIDEELSAVNADVLRELSMDLASRWEEGQDHLEVLESLRDSGSLGASHRSLSVNLMDDRGTLRWTLRVGMSSLADYRQTQRYVVESAAIVGTFLILASFFAALVASRLIEPLRRLSKAMARVGEGDLDQDLEASSGDELGQLTCVFNSMTAGLRQRERLRATLGRYVSSEVAERILEEADDLDLRGEVREVSVLFLDMRSFTSLAEKLRPQEIVELLNAYFEIIVSSILRCDGVINKFIGDAIMAVWGAPKPTADHAWRAVKAAWMIQRSVGAFNWERMKRRQEVIHIGIGINTGEAIAGNVGTSERLEYTVIGDEVNLAQRLEGIARPGQVLISSSTYKKVSRRVTANMLEEVRVKGRENPVTPYEVVDLVDDETDGACTAKTG